MFNQTSCFANKPHEFEWNFECTNLVNSNLHACHIISNKWNFECQNLVISNLHEHANMTINRMIKVHETSSLGKTMRKTLTGFHNPVLRPENSKEDTSGGSKPVREEKEI